MNGYVCFYKSQRIEVYADSSYAAQVKAANLLKVPLTKRWMVSVTLAEKDGKQVVHTPSE